MVQKPKKKTLNTKKEFRTNIESKEPIGKLTDTSNKESGSEYFPSTDSGKKKYLVF